MGAESQWSKSPWDHGKDELKITPTKAPFTYKRLFDREREQFGYNPRFMPGPVTFMPDNTPVIRFGMQGVKGSHHTSYQSRRFTTENYIQKLDRDGTWQISDSHVKALRSYLKLKPAEKLLIMSGERVPETVEFDNEGNAYTLVTARWRKRRYNSYFLLYSPDGMRSFQVYPLIGPRRIEPSFLHNNSPNKYTPVVLAQKKDSLGIYVLKRQADNTLKVSPYIKLADGKKLLFNNTMSGAGAPLITLGSKTFLVYSQLLPKKGSTGVPHYIVEYDHKTDKVSKPFFLGFSGHRIDGHNSSVIVADSKGFLHVVLGTHWHSMPYLKSKRPWDISEWEAPEYIGAGNNNDYSFDGLSYAGFIIDNQDRLYLIARGRSTKYVGKPTGRGNPVDYSLVAFVKAPGKEWTKRMDIIVPGHLFYSNYYQKVSLDRKGRVYLAYLYYVAHFWRRKVNQAMRDYAQRWGEEIGNEPKHLKSESSVRAHDPVLIHTPDYGQSWEITTSKELQKESNNCLCKIYHE